MWHDTPEENAAIEIFKIRETIKDKNSIEYLYVNRIKEVVDLDFVYDNPRYTSNSKGELYAYFLINSCVFGEKPYYNIPEHIKDRFLKCGCVGGETGEHNLKAFYYDDLGIMCGSAGFIFVEKDTNEIFWIATIMRS